MASLAQAHRLPLQRHVSSDKLPNRDALPKRSARLSPKHLSSRPLTCRASLLTSPAAKALPAVILSVVTASTGLFAGLAGAISLFEHPARMSTLAIPENVKQWRVMYEKALAINGGLAAFSAFSGLVGVILAAANNFPSLTTFALGLVAASFTFMWAFTVFIMFPVNYAIYKEHTEQEYRDLLVQWGKLHDVRSLVSTIAFLVVVVAGYKGVA